MSLIAWLDTSPNDEQRMRELVHMFSEPGTLDDLGVGQIRDALSDAMFPGITTSHTRARYLLFIPWIFHHASKSASGSDLLENAHHAERRFITSMLDAGHTDGLIGRVNNGQTTVLASSIYWSALYRYRILQVNRRPNQLHRHSIGSGRSEEDGDDSTVREWNIGVPAPLGFPRVVEAGFDLSADEARWLRERIVGSARDSYLAHILTSSYRDTRSAAAPWTHAALKDAPAAISRTVEHGRLVSLAVEGALLLYHLMVAERYVDFGFARARTLVEKYSHRLTNWAERVDKSTNPLQDWDLSELWGELERVRSSPVEAGTQLFMETWVDHLTRGGAQNAAASNDMRGLVADRERSIKKERSRLTNTERLAAWRAPTITPLTFRWHQARRICNDIIAGTDRAGT